ncbi:flagellar assembly protein FliW [Criibacterium bergeronii]|uniref:Flagellar assembly factor FliW n=1 Tax=Criibacterium bergeronii TaxID=1871336 RepID=A0A371IK52_9FIRM|nr:flagellar assembly protein FliW [Criibacterium bergeronii]RDY20872.1 flagellar assembly protein FliW [Criibacterium bergeronii]TRW28205.1 flagellar assembly protein FliW [Criibacterium bergeronii]
MKISTRYHGEMDIEESNILTLDEGMLGFEDLKRYIIIVEEDIFLQYLQCIDENIAFAIMDPFFVKPDYSFEIPDNVMKKLGITSEQDIVIRTTVVIPDDIEKIRTNLQAPIIFNRANNKGMQIILGDEYPMRYEFYHREGE